MAKIVKGESYEYKHYICLSIVFFQKKEKHWFMIYLKKLLHYGTIRIRDDGISEYVITGANAVETVLRSLLPFLKLKRKSAKIILKIIQDKKKVDSKEEFIKVCKLVDSIQSLTYSKLCENSAQSVINVLDDSPE